MKYFNIITVTLFSVINGIFLASVLRKYMDAPTVIKIYPTHIMDLYRYRNACLMHLNVPLA
jgi:hypothetical protein